MSTSLRKLTGDALKLHKLAQDGEIDQETFEATLAGVKGEIEVKAEKILAVDRQLASESDQLDQEIKRLQAMKRVRDNARDHLRSYLQINMDQSGIDKISCPLFTITLSKPKPKLDITDEDLLPSEYVDVQVQSKPKRSEILADLKAGKEIPGARIIDSARAVLIK